MAAEVLKDVLNKFISIESLLDWLSGRAIVNDKNDIVTTYKCNQVEFVSYFLNFLQEQSSVILQSSCTVETPCKNSQLRKKKNGINLTASHGFNDKFKSEGSWNSSEVLDLKSLESFPSLTDISSRSKSGEKSCGKYMGSTTKDSPCSGREYSRSVRRVRLFPGKTDHNTSAEDTDNSQYSLGHESQHSVTYSTPKSQNESFDIVDYFNDIVHLDGSPEWNPSVRCKGYDPKNEPSTSDRFKSNQSFGTAPLKPKVGNVDFTTSRTKDSKSSSRFPLEDFILNDTSACENRKDKKNKARKRINPTRINSTSSPCESKNSFEIHDVAVVNGSPSTVDRTTLRIECAGILESLGGKSLVHEYHQNPVSTRILSTPTKKILPTVDRVTYASELKTLSKIYSFILDENYCQNVLIEFCFVISLLVIQDHTSPEMNTKTTHLEQNQRCNLLGSVHNCVYFAVETLWLQRNILALLNLAALKLLSENSHIENFNPELKDFLLKAYVERQGKEILLRPLSGTASNGQGHVSFECETDNKDNFTNELSFHSFRKQRDLFYNILAIWEENHLSSDWVFSMRLGSKIRTLLSISSDPTNLLHLARLFRSQLVMSCCGDYQMDEDESNEEILQLLASVDPNKLLRLRARLKSTPKRQGPCPLPDFLGYQEFYKDFILSTSHTVFHYYLKNSLCDEILRLNDSEYASDMEDDDSCLDRETQSRYLEQINILCLLAKFLGFLEFLPYKTDVLLPDRVLSVHCAARENLLPLFDMEQCMKTALSKHKLTVTVPWIVNYLSMIDVCSARLKTYQKIWKILVMLYRELNLCHNLINAFYLRLILGWLFQLPAFPLDLFYNVLQDMNKNVSLKLSVEFSVGLDSYNFIEENILYSVCPYLNEINTILTENSGCNVKHIRPVTQGNGSTTSQAAKQIELRLEESFLHNQSPSTRKTIEFVTERVSSIAVKYLINDIIPKIKEKALKEIMDIFNKSNEKMDSNEELDNIYEKCYRELISACETESWRLCSTRSEKALCALLSADLDSIVNETCIQIVIRQATEKVKRWMEAHITLAIVRKEFTAIVARNCKKAQTSDISLDNLTSCSGVEIHHVISHPISVSNTSPQDLWSLSYIFISFREVTWSVYESENISWQDIDNVLDMAVKTLQNTENINLSVEKSLFGVAVDLLVIICVRCAEDINKEKLRKFSLLFKQCNEINSSGNSLERILCPRNVALLLRNAITKKKSWENIGNLLLYLMEDKLLSQDQVEAQLVSLLRQNWKKDEGKLYTDLLYHILNTYIKCNGCDKFTLLLEYLIDTLNDNEESKP